MNQFTVPQFIDVEDKIFGPITTRQFVILLSGGLLIFLCYKLADTMLFIFLLALIGGLSLIFAFIKINGQAFHYFVLNILQTFRRPGRRVWNKVVTTAELQILRRAQTPEAIVEKELAKAIPHQRIRDLSLLVNTGGYYKMGNQNTQ